MASKPKAFLEALDLFSTNPKKSKNFLNDQRLTQEEKTILKGFFLLKKNENEDLIVSITSLSSSPNSIVEAQKNLLLGIAYNNKNQYAPALKHLKLAQPIFEKEKMPRFELSCLLNFFIIYFNLKNKELMQKTIHKIRVFPTSSKLDQSRVLNCLFLYYTFTEQHEEAIKVTRDLKHFSLAENDKVSITTNMFCLYLKMENFDECYRQLDELKTFKNFGHSVNYNFMKKLLDHYVSNEPLYFQIEKFQKFPLQYHEISVIKCLEEGEMESALNHWNSLHAMNSQIYQNDFVFKGDKCLFSMNLQKWKNRLVNKTDQTIEVDDKFDFGQKIVGILKNAPLPVRKELLYELVFNTKMSDKSDLQRLSKNIYKLKKKSGIQIIYKKGCYSLEK